MDLKQLRHFVAIADHGTFSQAAKSVSISQPALTRSIQTLEARLGVTLLDRNTRGLRLTDSGQRLYQRAKLILNECDSAVSEAQNGPTPSISFKVGIAPMFASHLLPHAINRFSQSHTGLNLSISTGLFSDLTERLMEGMLDVVFSNLPLTPLPDVLAIEPMVDIKICYVASAHHPLAKRSSLSFGDVAAYPWAVIDEKNANSFYEYLFSEAGAMRSPVSVKTDSLSFLISLLRSPPWISLLPLHLVAPQIERGDLVQLDIGLDNPDRKAGLIFRKASSKLPLLMAFADEVRDTCASKTHISN